MQNKESKDPFIRLKYIAFCRNYMAPEDNSMYDLLNHAKNYLCLRKNRLFNDPIWSTYSDEALLVEFYSVRMDEDPDFRQQIEEAIKGKGNTIEDDIAWMEKREKEEDAKRAERLKEIQDEINFSHVTKEEG